MTREDVAIIQERRMSQQQQPPSELAYSFYQKSLYKLTITWFLIFQLAECGVLTPTREFTCQ